MHLEDALDEFLGYMKVERNDSEHTVSAYKGDIKLMVGFLTRNGIPLELESLTTPLIRQFLIELKEEKNYTGTTLNRKVNCYRSLFKYLMEQEYIAKNPMLKIRAPKKEEKLSIYLNEDELKRLMAVPEKNRRYDVFQLRDKAALLAYTKHPA